MTEKSSLKRRGRISKIWINELEDGRTYAKLKIEGDGFSETYSVWNKTYVKQIQDGLVGEGSVIDYSYKKSGKYLNIQKFRALENESEKPQSPKARTFQGAPSKTLR